MECSESIYFYLESIYGHEYEYISFLAQHAHLNIQTQGWVLESGGICPSLILIVGPKYQEYEYIYPLGEVNMGPDTVWCGGDYSLFRNLGKGNVWLNRQGIYLLSFLKWSKQRSWGFEFAPMLGYWLNIIQGAGAKNLWHFAYKSVHRKAARMMTKNIQLLYF